MFRWCEHRSHRQLCWGHVTDSAAAAGRAARHRCASPPAGPARPVRGHQEADHRRRDRRRRVRTWSRAEGYDALTMRRLATRPWRRAPPRSTPTSSIKDDLGELLVGRLCTVSEVPEPEPGGLAAAARRRLHPAARPVPALPGRHPGHASAIVPTNLDTPAGQRGDSGHPAGRWRRPADRRLDDGCPDALPKGHLPPTRAPRRHAAPAAETEASTGWSIATSSRAGLEALPDTFPQTRRYAAG